MGPDMIRHDPQEVADIICGRKVVVSVSGGKDSTATSLYLKELGIEHDRVFADTGWEHQITLEYVDKLQSVLGPIVTVRDDRGMEGLCRHKGMFPGRLVRFCTQFLKVNPIKAYLNSLGSEFCNVVGIRAAESKARSKLQEWEQSDELGLVWRPIISWTFDDVVEIHKRHGVSPNPLYLKGAERVGCWPCIYSRKAEIRLVADMSPERIDKIRELEKEVQAAAAERYAKRGETFESLGYTPPTFFSLSTAGGSVTIDHVVEWSRTSRGGRQFELFDLPESERGCVRWGMCETYTEDQE